MKSFIILFSSYLLLLCAMPCILQPVSENNDICCESSGSADTHKDKSDRHNGCNPLSCGCVLSYDAGLHAIDLFNPSSESLKIYSKHSIYSLIVSSIWQPPKLS